MKQLDRAAILAMIPHGATICQLDAVQDWDEAGLRCLSARFSAPENPLRRADGALGAACAIEMACQAMAVHGRLTGPQNGPPAPGFLVSLRDVHLAAPVLDAGPLLITVARLMGEAQGASYSFTVAAAGAACVSGRATVMFGSVV